MQTRYRSAIIRQFCDQQTQAASPRELLEQAARAETLLGRLKPQQAYAWSEVLSGLAPGQGGGGAVSAQRISAAELCHDLPLLIEDLSDAANVPVTVVGQRVLNADELARTFNVSTKTIARWRQQGLIARKFLIDGRKRVGFLKSSVDHFVAHHRERVQRGSRFRQMTDDERERIITDARKMAAAGAPLGEIASHLATTLQRSPGTIRGVINQHDRAQPDRAICPTADNPLTDEIRAQIYQQYREGESIDTLARRYGRAKTTIYRIVSRYRYERIMRLPLEFIPNRQFARIRKDKDVLGPLPPAETPVRKTRMPKDLPSYLASLYEVPLLTRVQEQHLFRKFNYLKYRASRLRDQLNSSRPQTRLMDRIEKLFDLAVATKNQIVRANLRLVVSIAKRHVGPGENFFELVSDGNISLIRAVEKFDFARGFKFSTYASWAIMKNFARSIPNELKRRDRFRTSHDETFSVAEESRSDWFGQEIAQRQRLNEVAKILDRLDDREQKIIIHRFGLDYAREPQTLKQVGEAMGVTKERVRQIEARALHKLRVAAAEENIDFPESVE
ncbi:MAG: sigma-70 family RNA polymerase sigma factor [Planctomycetales bacterium]|nr:sigma-70 family RNA polymerase sigma factor [Planctomycetales bacterium]